MLDKKPDNIVYDEEHGYHAKLLPYASNVGAPVITTDDVVTWKTTGIQKVNKELEAKFNDIKAEYHRLLEEYRWNEFIYNAKFSFEPVIGEVYYMYLDKNGNEFLSLIGPQEWKQKYIATVQLNADRKWIVLDKTNEVNIDL